MRSAICACALLVIAAPAAVAAGAVSLVSGAPTASTGASSSVTASSATVKGTVNPKGQPTTYVFEYGTTTAYGTQTNPADAGAGATSVPVSAQLSSLTPATTYHYRVVATNPSGTTTGGDHSFKTANGAASSRGPAATTGAASNVAQTSVTLTGTVDPKGQPTQYFFQLGPTTAYGAQTPATDAGAGKAPVKVSATVGSLAPNTVYHYRLVATSAAGTSFGRDNKVGTGPAPKAVTFAASATTISFGQFTNFTGQVGAPRPPFVTIVLQRASGASGPWVDDQQTAANKDGTYSFPEIGPGVNTYYRTVAAGTASPPVLISVAFRAGLTVHKLHPRRGSRVRFRGLVAPAHPGLLVSIQRLGRGGRWHTVRRAQLHGAGGNLSSYSVRVRIRRSGGYRVAVPSDGTHVGSVSRVVRIRVH